MKWIAIILLELFVLYAGFTVSRGVLVLPEFSVGSSLGAWMSSNANFLAAAFGVLAAMGVFKPIKFFVESFSRGERGG